MGCLGTKEGVSGWAEPGKTGSGSAGALLDQQPCLRLSGILAFGSGQAPVRKRGVRAVSEVASRTVGSSLQ